MKSVVNLKSVVNSSLKYHEAMVKDLNTKMILYPENKAFYQSQLEYQEKMVDYCKNQMV